MILVVLPSPMENSRAANRLFAAARPPQRPRSSSHPVDCRAIQSQACAIDSKRPISSIVPSSHSASTYQWVSSAVLIWRGLKIGRGNLGRLVDMRLAEPERGEQSHRSESIGPAKEGSVARAGKM